MNLKYWYILLILQTWVIPNFKITKKRSKN